MTGYRCFFEGQGPCHGALIAAHLIPRQLLKREFPNGAVKDGDRWRPLTRCEDRYDLKFRSLTALIHDPRSFVPCCGGPMGNAGHHGALDVSKRLRIARADLPAGVEEYAAELGLTWYLERTYKDELSEEAA
jgi:hypothetical protein